MVLVSGDCIHCPRVGNCHPVHSNMLFQVLEETSPARLYICHYHGVVAYGGPGMFDVCRVAQHGCGEGSHVDQLLVLFTGVSDPHISQHPRYHERLGKVRSLPESHDGHDRSVRSGDRGVTMAAAGGTQ
uniref:Uncharacterized protein n=1 Tax=Cacopsylla melanoneura TaxID=428564 RepID=A0A8D8UQG3_9HEMI